MSRLARITTSHAIWKSSTVSLWQTPGPGYSPPLKAYNYILTGNVSMGSAARFKRAALMVPRCRWISNPAGIIARALAYAWAFGGIGRCPNVCSAIFASKLVSKGGQMRTREMFFSPWQAADYTGLKVEAIYELLASGEIAGEQVDGRGRRRKSQLDEYLDGQGDLEERKIHSD